MIIEKHKLIFIRNPKTASSSIIRYFFDDVKPGFHEKNRIDTRKVWSGDLNHYPLFVLNDLLEPSVLNSHFKFSFVRNPFDRIASSFAYMRRWYNQNNQPKPDCLNSFKKYITSIDQPQYKLSQYEFTKGCDFIGRYENLKTEFNNLCNILGLEFDPNRLPHVNKTKRKHYSKFYDDECIEITSNLFAKDLERFNYTFERI